MCTSFAVYGSQTLYGLNFDWAEVEIRLRVATEAEGSIFFFCPQYDGQFIETAGMNASGLYAAAQVLYARYDIAPPPNDRPVQPRRVIRKALSGATTVEDVLGIIGDRRLDYRTERKGHQIYADRHGEALIVEPGPAGNVIGRVRRPYVIMTNFACARCCDADPETLSGVGIDRYRTAHRVLADSWQRFDVTAALDLLARTAIRSGRYATQCSLVYDPLGREVYVVLRRDYSRLWRIRLMARSIEELRDGAVVGRRPISDSGVLASELRAGLGTKRSQGGAV